MALVHKTNNNQPINFPSVLIGKKGKKFLNRLRSGYEIRRHSIRQLQSSDLITVHRFFTARKPKKERP